MDTLPLEILDIICVHLTKRDLKNSSRVCKSWQSVFIRLLYTEIVLRSIHQLNQFHFAVNSNHVGHHVRKLNMSALNVSSKVFYDIMAHCPYIVTLIMPSNFLCLDYLLSPDMPEMYLLSEIHNNNINSDYQITHVTLCMLLLKSPQAAKTTISTLSTFSQLTHLTITVSQYDWASDLFEDILYLCPGLYSLNYAFYNHGKIIQNKYPETQYLSLRKLDLAMLQCHPEDREAIQYMFPRLKDLGLVMSGALKEDDHEWLKVMMDIRHLRSLIVKFRFIDKMAWKEPLFDLWNYAMLLTQGQEKETKKCVEFNTARDPFAILNLTRYPCSNLRSLYFMFQSYSSTRQLGTQFVKSLGHQINRLTLGFNPDDIYGLVKHINSTCLVLTELNVDMSTLSTFSSDEGVNENITKLTVRNCLVRASTMKVIGSKFIHLKTLVLESAIVDRIERPGNKSVHICIQLPPTVETLISSVPSTQSDILFTAEKLVDNLLVCRWHYDTDLKRTVITRGHLLNFSLARVCFQSHTLKTCIFTNETGFLLK
ncbi:hypothetical protein BDB01DRAFT_899061 [Pilobolus umbonatus]|nr:hypothetical protein BDB01DRAFT_899061 [Pilobolus umbonatus]